MTYEVDPEDYAPPHGSVERELFEIITLGVEAKQFLESEVATFILESAEAKSIEASNKLAVVNPADTKKIIELQTEIAKYSHFVNSLNDMVTAGDAAYQQYHNLLTKE